LKNANKLRQKRDNSISLLAQGGLYAAKQIGSKKNPPINGKKKKRTPQSGERLPLPEFFLKEELDKGPAHNGGGLARRLEKDFAKGRKPVTPRVPSKKEKNQST